MKFKSQLTHENGKEAPKVSKCVIQDSCWQRSELTRSDRPIMQMSFRSTIRSMVRNMKETFPPKTNMQKKQVLPDSWYVKDVEDACCMLSAK